MLVFLQRCGLSFFRTAPIFTLLSGKAKSYILYLYFIYKTMYTSDKKRTSFFVIRKYKGNVENQQIEFWNLKSSHVWNPESMDVESGIHRHGIRNPQTWNPESTAWNPESKTLLDYLTWGELLKGHCHDEAHVRSWLTPFFWLANRNLNTIKSATNSPGVSRAFRKYSSAGFWVFVCKENLLCLAVWRPCPSYFLSTCTTSAAI